MSDIAKEVQEATIVSCLDLISSRVSDIEKKLGVPAGEDLGVASERGDKVSDIIEQMNLLSNRLVDVSACVSGIG